MTTTIGHLVSRPSIKPIQTAVATVRTAATVGNYQRARNAARLAVREMGLELELPTVDHPETWALVAQILANRLGAVELLRLRHRAAFAG